MAKEEMPSLKSVAYSIRGFHPHWGMLTLIAKAEKPGVKIISERSFGR